MDWIRRKDTQVGLRKGEGGDLGVEAEEVGEGVEAVWPRVEVQQRQRGQRRMRHKREHERCKRRCGVKRGTH